MDPLTADHRAADRDEAGNDRPGRGAGALFHHAVPWGGSVVLVVVNYVVVRWLPSPLTLAAVLDSLALLLLGALAYHGVRRQFAAPYVVTALVLPSMLTVVLAWAGMQRLESEITELLRSVFPFLPVPP